MRPDPDEVTTRVRQPADLLGFGAVGALVVILLLVAHGLPTGTLEVTRDVARVVGRLPRLLMVVLAAVAAIGALVLVVVIAVTLARSRLRDALNAGVAAISAGLIGTAGVAAWHAWPGPVARAMLHGTDGSMLVRDAALVALLTGADVVRTGRFTRYCVAVVAALLLTGLALGDVTPLAAAVAPFGGWAVGLGTRWALGATVRQPSIEALRQGLARGGIDVASLARPETRSKTLHGALADGTPVLVYAAGREVRGSGAFRRFWSVVRLREAATGHQPRGLRSELQTEALASLMAANAGVSAPRVLLLAHLEPDTLVLAREERTGPALTSSTPAEDATRLFHSLRKLHAIGVAHRNLRAEELVCDGAATGFRSLDEAVVGAGELVQRLDLAQLLTSIGSTLGAPVAVQALRAGYLPEDERAVASILQPLALRTWGWSAMKAGTGCLNEVRRELLGPGETAPATRLERFRWRTVIGAVAMTFAAFLLVGQLSKVNLLGALRHTNLGWFAIALVGSAVTYVGSSLNLVAFVPQRVSVIKGSLVELSGAFLGLVTPPTVGHVAVNGRFLRREGVDTATTAAAVAVSQVVNFLTTISLLVVTALLTGTGVGRLKILPGPRLLLVIGGLVVLFGLSLLVPAARRVLFGRVWPRFRSALPHLLEVLAQPVRLLAGIGGNLLLTGGYIVALLASLHAVGAHPPIIATAAVYMAGNAVGSVAPTPGGLGAIETVMAAGLTAIGIPAHEAVPSVLIFRVATFWLPILPGWVTFLILQRREIL